MDFYGTIGPACADVKLLQQMAEAGMTGIRMNLSHGPLAAHTDWLAMIRAAGIRQLLTDLQGPELRIGTLAEPVALVEGSSVRLGADGVPCPAALVQAAAPGQQLLLGAYSALSRQIGLGKVKMYTRHEMLDVVKVDGRARGIIARNLITGKIERFAAYAVVVATGGYVNTFFLSTNAMASNGSAAWQCYKKGAYFANPCMVQIHPTCVPVKGDFQSKLTLMSESLRNDGRIWVQKKLEDAPPPPPGTPPRPAIP